MNSYPHALCHFGVAVLLLFEEYRNNQAQSALCAYNNYKQNSNDIVGTYLTKRCEDSWCPNEQRLRCKNFASNRDKIDLEKFKAALAKLGLKNDFEYDMKNDNLFVKGEMTHEQVAYISQKFMRRIKVEKIKSEHEWGGYVLGHNDIEIKTER